MKPNLQKFIFILINKLNTRSVTFNVSKNCSNCLKVFMGTAVMNISKILKIYVFGNNNNRKK